MGIRENFKRGSIEMLILYLLGQEDMYGYQLAQEINTRSEGLFDITEGSMYPTLYRLIEKNAITDHRELIGKRRTRVYYHLEAAGAELLQELVNEYASVNGGIAKIMKDQKFTVPKAAAKAASKAATKVPAKRGRKKKIEE